MKFPKLLDACKKISGGRRTSSMNLVVISVISGFPEWKGTAIVGNCYISVSNNDLREWLPKLSNH